MQCPSFLLSQVYDCQIYIYIYIFFFFFLNFCCLQSPFPEIQSSVHDVCDFGLFFKDVSILSLSFLASRPNLCACRHTFEDSTGKKAHVTDLMMQRITFPVFFPTTMFSPTTMFWLNTINKAQGKRCNS